MSKLTPGWYEFPKEPAATTHIAYVYENGDLYLPESEVDVSDFTKASDKGTTKRLVPSTETEMAVKAIVHTVEYVGFDTLPAIIGWSWYAALIELDPDVAREMKQAYLKHLAVKEPRTKFKPSELPQDTIIKSTRYDELWTRSSSETYVKLNVSDGNYQESIHDVLDKDRLHAAIRAGGEPNVLATSDEYFGDQFEIVAMPYPLVLKLAEWAEHPSTNQSPEDLIEDAIVVTASKLEKKTNG